MPATDTPLARSRGPEFVDAGFLAISDYPSHYAVLRPDHVALVDDRRSWTYAELDSDSNRFVSLLQSYGVNAGDRSMVGQERWCLHRRHHRGGSLRSDHGADQLA